MSGTFFHGICITFFAIYGLEIKAGFVRLDEFITIEWSYGYTREQLSYQIVAETKDYISLGFSKDGNWTNADVISGIVDEDGTFLEDRHVYANGTLLPDSVQNYAIVEGAQNDSHTRIIFTRPVNSCDDEDYPITLDTTKLLWNIGADTSSVDGFQKKSKSINFLTQMDTLPPDTYEEFNLKMYPRLDGQDTMFWCGFVNTLNKTSSTVSVNDAWIVAFEAILEKAAIPHVHHMDIYQCGEGMDQFPSFIHGNCDDFRDTGTRNKEVSYCTESLVISWSNGGNVAVFPNDVGLTINRNGYYMLHMHIDNPDKVSNVQFEAGFRLYHTAEDEPRDMEAGQVQLATMEEKIPPNSVNHTTAARFEATDAYGFPNDSAITIFGVTFHSHLSGVRMRLRHFKDKVELPWILKDDNYDFNFQQAHMLPTPVKVESGDQLVLECTFNTVWKHNKSVEYGVTTSDEMCMAFVLYYPKVEDFAFWNSATDHYQLSGSDLNTFLGITDLYSDDDYSSTEIVKHPKKWKNWTVSKVFEQGFDWTAEARVEYETLNKAKKYPTDFTKYVPPNPCQTDMKPNNPPRTIDDELLSQTEQLNNGVAMVDGNVDNLREKIEILQDRVTNLTYELQVLRGTIDDLTNSVENLTKQFRDAIFNPLPDMHDQTKFVYTIAALTCLVLLGTGIGILIYHRCSNNNGIRNQKYSILTTNGLQSQSKEQLVLYENEIQVDEDADLF